MNALKHNLFKLSMVFCGNMILGAVSKKFNVSMEKQALCVGTSLLLVAKLNTGNNISSVVENCIVSGTGFIAGKVFYDTFIRHQTTLDLLSLESVKSLDSEDKTLTELSTTEKEPIEIYKHLYYHLPIIVSTVVVVGGLIFVGCMSYKNHKDLQERFSAVMRICYNQNVGNDYTYEIKDIINLQKAIKMLTEKSAISHICNV